MSVRAILSATVLLLASPAAAQGVVQAPLVNTAALATKADLSAAVPATCASPPMPDSFGGTAGVAMPCVPRADAARPTNVQPASGVTDAGGNWSVSWPSSFASIPTTVFASIRSTAAPYTCQAGTISATGATGRCWAITAMTLPTLVTALLGMVLTPYAAPPTGSTVMVVGRQ